MKGEIFLDDLNETGVSILTKKYLEEDGENTMLAVLTGKLIRKIVLILKG